MNTTLEEKLTTAIWIGNSLFTRSKTSGSSANMSFEHNNKIYITGSGTCFGTLSSQDFSVISRDGIHLFGISPSKEYPLHLELYHKNDNIKAVIHTHSFYATLWSCLEHKNPNDVIPPYTPYLKMKLGSVGLIPYGKPGSKELFEAFAERINRSNGYLLKNHGPVVGGTDLMSAFFLLEELEESAHAAWELRGEKIDPIP